MTLISKVMKKVKEISDYKVLGYTDEDRIKHNERQSMKAPKIKGGNKTVFYNSKLLKDSEIRSSKPVLQFMPFNTFGVFRDLRSL